jgi:hypothetical protein
MNSFFSSSSAMGIQSQRANSAIRKCLQFGTIRRRNLRQTAVNDRNANGFDPDRDCKTCVRGGSSIYKKPHHVKCPKNKKTKGLPTSKRTQEVEQHSEQMEAIMAAEMESSENEVTLNGGMYPSVASHFGSDDNDQELSLSEDGNSRRFRRNPEDDVGQQLTKQQHREFTTQQQHHDEDIEFLLEKAVRTWYSSSKNPSNNASSQPTSSKNKNSPPGALVAIVDMIIEKVQFRRSIKLPMDRSKEAISSAAQANFNAIFGKNNMMLEIPRINDVTHCVHPHFHALAGCKFIYMDLEMSHPSLVICCPCCGSSAVTRERNDYSKNRSLFPIVDCKSEIWALPFKYSCRGCSKIFSTMSASIIL